MPKKASYSCCQIQLITKAKRKSSAHRVVALLNAHGLQWVAMLRDNDCLFSAVAFQLKHRYYREGIDSPLNQHLCLLGIEADKTGIQTIGQTLRELIVQEFLGVHRDEYASYLDLTHREHFENMANNFFNRGFLTVNWATPPLLL